VTLVVFPTDFHHFTPKSLCLSPMIMKTLSSLPLPLFSFFRAPLSPPLGLANETEQMKIFFFFSPSRRSYSSRTPLFLKDWEPSCSPQNRLSRKSMLTGTNSVLLYHFRMILLVFPFERPPTPWTFSLLLPASLSFFFFPVRFRRSAACFDHLLYRPLFCSSD